MFGTRTTTGRRAGIAPVALAAAVLSSAVLAASVTGTLSAFTASITNTGNTAASGSLIMQETDAAGSVSCISSSASNNANASCSTINKYGGTTNQLIPGGIPNSTTIRISNTGTTAANAFTLAPDTCTKTSGTTTGSLCSQLRLTLTCAPVTGGTVGTAVTLYNAVALNALTTKDIKAASTTCVPATNSTNSVQFVFSVQLDSGADNTVQAQTVSQPLTWTFTGA